MTDLERIAQQLPGWSDVPKMPEDSPGQTELFPTGRALPPKQRKDYARGQDFLFDTTTSKETEK